MAKITKLRELLKLMVIKEVNSMASSGMIGTSPDIIQTPGAFTGNKPSREEKRKKNGEVSGLKRAEILRKDFVTEGKFKDALFEDVINKVTFGMKLSDQAKELMDFVRGSKQHAEELGQIGELLKGMGDSGDTTNQQAFELYQEFLENAARDFVRLNASDMKPEEYFLKKDLLQLTYYFTQKFATPMTQGPDAIDKEPGQEPEAGMPPEDGEGGDDGGGGGSMGGGGGSMPPTDGAEEIPQPGEEGEEAPPEGGEGEIPPEGGEGEVPPEGEEEDPRKPPKPENIRESRMVGFMKKNLNKGLHDYDIIEKAMEKYGVDREDAEDAYYAAKKMEKKKPENVKESWDSQRARWTKWKRDQKDSKNADSHPTTENDIVNYVRNKAKFYLNNKSKGYRSSHYAVNWNGKVYRSSDTRGLVVQITKAEGLNAQNVKETWDSSKYQHNQMMKKARKNADPKRAYKQYLTQLNKNVKPKSYDEWYAQWNVGRN